MIGLNHSKESKYLIGNKIVQIVIIEKFVVIVLKSIPENKEIFIYGFKRVKTDKLDNYNLIGCESDELYENNKLFIFWSNKFLRKEIGKRDFKLTGWLFVTSVKRNNFVKIQGICM